MLTRALPALALAPLLLLSACGSGSTDDKAGDTATDPAPTAHATTSSASGGAGSCSYPSDGAGSAGKKVTAPPATPAVSGTVPVSLQTSIGKIGLTLDATKAPCTVNSFVSLAKQGYFDSTGCHRLTTQGIFVLQCGDPSGSGSGGPGYSFADELGGAQALATDEQATREYQQQTGQKQDIKTYPAGTIAMANAGPDTNGSQFFLVYADSPLPPAYTVFGTIDDAGVQLIRTDAASGTDNGADGHPKQPVDIKTAAVG